MNAPQPRLRRIFPLLLATGILLACSNEPGNRVAGGEDFPNTLEALGRALAEGLDSAGTWNGLADAASYPSSPSLPDSSALVATRALALLCTPAADSGYLGDSLVFQSKTTCVEGSTLRDSLVIRIADSLIRLVVQDSTGPLGLSRLVRSYEADSAPGFRLSGYAGRVRLRTEGSRGRWKTLTEVVLDAGADLAWSTESDNNVWRGGQALVRDGIDTLDRWTVRPFPLRNAPIYRPEEGDSGLASIERRQVLSTGAIREESGVLMIFRQDSLNYPVRSRIRVVAGAESSLEESVQGNRADSTFRPGDSATYLRRVHRGSDSLREEIRLIASASPRDHSGDRITFLSSRRFRSGANERTVSMVATPSEPIHAGSPFTDGHVVLEIGLADGNSLRFEGTMSAGVASGRWVSRTDSGSVRLDARGRILEASP